LVYRRDLIREAGLDPNSTPRDWEEFYRWMQKLTRPKKTVLGAPVQRGQVGWYYWGGNTSYLLPWIWAAGGNLVLEGKTNPRTGKTYWFPKEEIAFIDPDTGESLRKQPSKWKAALDTPEMRAALEFLWRCFHQPWVRDPSDNTCMDLTAKDVKRGSVRRPDGKIFKFKPDEIIRGVARYHPTESPSFRYEGLNRGEFACIITNSPDPYRRVKLKSSQIGFWAVPPRRAEGKAVVGFEQHWIGMSSALGGNDKKRNREKAWKIVSGLGGPIGKQAFAQYAVEQGWERFLKPEDLIEAGLEEYVESIPQEWRQQFQQVLKNSRFPPYNQGWLPVQNALLHQIVQYLIADENYDWRAALAQADHEANTRVMTKRDAAEMARYRPWAWSVLALLAAALAGLLALVIRKGLRVRRKLRAEGTLSPVQRGWLPWLFLAPALLSIIVWSYLPLARGTLIAFQDYRIMGGSRWVGMDNFIAMFLDQRFYQYVWATLRYLGYNLVIGFLAPIFLAILLNEVPRFKRLFRTFFFLPQLSSAIVIMLLWKVIFYAPEEWGILNRIVAGVAKFFGADVQAQRWLQDTRWAMPAVVVTAVWAGAGMASLIYLAALKIVPDDLYEAAEIDGAGIWQKLRWVTLPTLYPLMIINFTGAFIGTLHSMQNIFVMTGGAADTTVLSLAIWYEAFAYLKFGAATAMAWILGTMVIGFTLWQLRILRRVEFRRAEDV